MSSYNDNKRKKSCKAEEEKRCKRKKEKKTKGIKKTSTEKLEKNIKKITEEINCNNQILARITSNFKINRRSITNGDKKKNNCRGRCMFTRMSTKTKKKKGR
jgi:hypothetical protein